jgi:acyl-CoA thioesterase FadM
MDRPNLRGRVRKTYVEGRQVWDCEHAAGPVVSGRENGFASIHPRARPLGVNTLEMRATVPTAAVGASATLRLSALMGMMQEIASLHAERLGVGYHAMLAQRRGFVLSRLQMEFCGEWPRWGDELLLRTWPRGIERLFALREFVISRSDGTVFMRASTGWAVIDVDKVRLIRPDDVLAGLLPNRRPRCLGGPRAA